MRSVGCRSVEADLWMGGVVAFLNDLNVKPKSSELEEEAPFGAPLDTPLETLEMPWETPEDPPAITLTVGPTARVVTMHHLRNLLEPVIQQDGRPEEVVRNIQCLCAEALRAECHPGPFYLRRVVEEYEQWTHTGISEVREWLESDVPAEDKVRWLNEAYSWLACEAIHSHGTLPDAVVPGHLFPTTDGSCRIMRSPPALARWTHYLRSMRTMTPQHVLETLLVLSRWNPAQAMSQVHMTMCVHEQILSSLELLNQSLTIPDTELRGIAAAAFYDTEADVTPEAEAAAPPDGAPTPLAGVLGGAGQVDEVFEQTVADVAEFVSTMKESLTTYWEELSAVSGARRRDLMEERIRERSCGPAFWRWMEKLAMGRFLSLRGRYLEAYERCRDRFLVTYFDNAAGAADPTDEFRRGAFPVAEFPVGSEVKIRSFADYRNRDLRDRAWMEEVLVRGLTHILCTLQEPVEFVWRTHEPITFRLPIIQVYAAYETAMPELVHRVAFEQGYEYATRAAMVLVATLHQRLTAIAATLVNS